MCAGNDWMVKTGKNVKMVEEKSPVEKITLIYHNAKCLRSLNALCGAA